MIGRLRLVVAMAATLATTALAGAQPLLVVPFELERFDARVGWLGEGVAIGLTAAAQARGLGVVSREARLAALERLQLPPAATLTRATLVKVAELVGATRVIVGRVAEHDGTITLRGQVVDVESATLSDLTAEVAPATTLFTAFTGLAAQLGGHAPEPGPTIAPSVPAFESYVRGLVAPAVDSQQRLLQQALAMAPSYADARAALWDVQTTRALHQAALATVGGVSGAGVTDGDRTPWRLRAASSLVHLGRYDEAFTLLSALASRDRSAAVPALLGVVQLRRGGTPQTGRATYYFNQAVERDASDSDACFNLGYAYWLDKDALAAAYWLREAVRRTPSDGDAHFVLAAALAASGAAPEADRERELARRLSDRWERAAATDSVPKGLERLPDPAGRITPALVSALNAGVQRDQRELAAFHLDAARRAFAGGRDQEAIREVQRALYLTPYDVEALQVLGRAQARSGLLQEAAGTFKIAIWSAESAALQVELGEVLLRLHDVTGALKAAERALVLEPTHAGARDLATRVRRPRPGA